MLSCPRYFYEHFFYEVNTLLFKRTVGVTPKT